MLRSLFKTLTICLGLLGLAFSAVCNWFVHQPRYWQQSESQKLPAPVASWAARIGNASADLTDMVGLTGRDVTAPLPTHLNTNRLVCAGWPARLPGSAAASNDITVLSKKGFAVGYSPSLRHPVWAVYKTCPARSGTVLPRPSGFKPDEAARNSPQAKDYAKSGYDRGHMAPNLAIATRYGKGAQEETFLTSNICPQRAGLNQGPWRDLEFRIAELWPDCYGEVWVIVGAISNPNGKRLPSGVDIPSAFYQIVVAQAENQIRAFAVYMPQNIWRRTYTRSTLVSIDEIEKLSGFDFLSELPDEIEKPLESATPTRLWPAGPTGAIKLIREHFKVYDTTWSKIGKLGRRYLTDSRPSR